jgi:hypothetical protein
VPPFPTLRRRDAVDVESLSDRPQRAAGLAFDADALDDFGSK